MFGFSKSTWTQVCNKNEVLFRFQTDSAMKCLSFEPSLYQQWIDIDTNSVGEGGSHPNYVNLTVKLWELKITLTRFEVI